MLITFEDPRLAGGLLAGSCWRVFVAEDVSFQAEIELADGLVRLVGQMNVHEDTATTDPDLAMKACSQCGGLAAAKVAECDFVRGH